MDNPSDSPTSSPGEPTSPKRDPRGRRSASGREMNSAAGKVGAAIRWGKPIPWDAAAKLGLLAETSSEVVGKQGQFHDLARSVYIEASPLIARRVVKIALGRIKRASVADELAAAKLAHTYASLPNSTGADMRTALQELTLDQLETILAGALTGVKDAQAIDVKGFVVPTQGIGQAVEPDPTQPGERSEAPSSERPLTPGGGVEG